MKRYFFNIVLLLLPLMAVISLFFLMGDYEFTATTFVAKMNRVGANIRINQLITEFYSVFNSFGITPGPGVNWTDSAYAIMTEAPEWYEYIPYIFTVIGDIFKNIYLFFNLIVVTLQIFIESLYYVFQFAMLIMGRY